MKRNDKVYNIICQSGPSRVLTVAPLQLCTPDIKHEFTQDPTDEHESDPKIVTKLKSGKPSERQETNSKLLPKYVIIPDTVAVPKAYAVIPRILQHKSNEISPRRPLPEHARFGPVQGVTRTVSSKEVKLLVRTHANDFKPLYLISDKDGASIHIDVSDPDKSNWISLLPLGTQSTANIWLCQEEGNLYAVTTKSIDTREPLKIGYSSEYVQAHDIPTGQPICDLSKEFNKPDPLQLRCDECSVIMRSSEELERHKSVYHTENVSSKLRCKYCCKKFTRRFTLKRHVALRCTKKAKIKDETTPDNSTANPLLLDSITCVTQQNTTEDEHRLPSDESLQNFSSILDFSTNLFDTDRISNLDISVTRSDNDFNLMNDFDFDEALVDSVDSPEKGMVKSDITSIKKTSSPYTCTFCKQIVPKTKVRQHAKLCMKRRFHCQMCRRFFRSKENLALHVFKVHKEDESTEQTSEKSEDIKPYKCLHCQLAFKRRGMLVNHMSRSHGTIAARLPLLVRDRRFPCPSCPKLYSAAAKRDLHVAAHHPGTVYNRQHSIEIGQCVKQASSCWLCPRQYATKAKLMQHVRQRHPGAGMPKETSS